MKIIHLSLTSLFLCIVCINSTAAGSAVPIQASHPPAIPVELGTDVNNLVFTGKVKRIPAGTALVTENATYMLTGGNFEGIVGMEVNIIGKVIREGSVEKIKVARAQLAQR